MCRWHEDTLIGSVFGVVVATDTNAFINSDVLKGVSVRGHGVFLLVLHGYSWMEPMLLHEIMDALLAIPM